MQVGEACAAANEPAAHGVHAVAPASDVCPKPHGVHGSSPVALKVPAAHVCAAASPTATVAAITHPSAIATTARTRPVCLPTAPPPVWKTRAR